MTMEPLASGEEEKDTLDSHTIPINELENKMEEFIGDHEGQLAIDVYQTQNAIIIESPIAGVDVDDLDISINNESVTIKGKRERENTITDEAYFHQECYWGKFSRSVILPQEIEAERAEASVKNGILTIRLPKLTRQKTRKLKIHSDHKEG